VRTQAVKVYADGALGSRGAALFAPYADAPGEGLLLLQRGEAAPMFDAALRAGLQVCTHAIGDKANALVLDWYAEALGRTPRNARAVAEPRWRIEHAQVVRPQDFARFQGLGVIASMQPSHAISDLYFAPARLGPKRLEGAYAWRSLLASGAVIAGGSDAPVERGDPLIEFYAAIARRDLAGASGPDWSPEEAVARSQALAMFTSGPAFAAFEEQERGALTPGRYADVSVFSVDLLQAEPAAILKGRALLTLIEGKQAFRAADW
jgi:predicted amidohydrolase YtcJ